MRALLPPPQNEVNRPYLKYLFAIGELGTGIKLGLFLWQRKSLFFLFWPGHSATTELPLIALPSKFDTQGRARGRAWGTEGQEKELQRRELEVWEGWGRGGVTGEEVCSLSFICPQGLAPPTDTCPGGVGPADRHLPAVRSHHSLWLENKQVSYTNHERKPKHFHNWT